ncbi:sarcolemma associated protein [Nomia melanderi]|uniref:sarcolemma associated protein n=1 Tax=Nomia melanderi TaxID=2448451 RepID=UPI00130477CB|nr:sarcolemmal membrane-associated protein [Nomia melanderi]
MVVASGGWVQNASFPTGQNNSNLNINATQNNKMTAKGVLICRENSHPFQERTLTLEQPVKIGRSVAKATAAPNNAIFDCKVLSRNHALLWYSSGKFYLQDTRSSNGTFVNNHRLGAAGLESAPKEVYSGDIVQFGVDVMESTKKFKHGCIVATLRLYLPDEKEASVNTSITSAVNNVSLEDLYKLNQVMQEASRREKALQSKLGYLQQLVTNTQKVANQSWRALIAEDRLLSWVETIENQLSVYSKNYTEDKIRNKLVKLLEEKALYQNAAKEELQKILQEKLEISQRFVQLQERLNETEGECQSLHNLGKHTQTELQVLSKKYADAQKKLQETTNKLNETEEKMKDTIQNVEQEKQELLKRLEDQSRIEKNLQARLRNSRLDSVNIYKQITALRNYMQILQDMNSKSVTSDNLQESKDEENPIEAINIILNKLNSIHADNMDIDMESSFCPLKEEQDNQINSQDIDSNQLKNSDISFSKEELDDSLANNDNVTEYILPPPSRKTLVNGNVNVDNSDINSESDTNSDATDDACSITSDDTSEKSVIEVKTEESGYVVAEEIFVPHKMEVRFACEESSKQPEALHQLQITPKIKDSEERETTIESTNSTKSLSESVSIEINQHEKKDEGDKDSSEIDEECETEHLEGDYVKTLKPMSKNDAQQNLYTREYLLQALIGSLDSLKLEDDLESQQAVKKELENLKDWLVNEPSEEIIEKLKKLYYRAKNESQRIQELHEELVILKEKYNAFVEEKAELSKKYTALRAQCGDLLNTSYSVPIHYVAPIAIMLVWMLLQKIF